MIVLQLSQIFCQFPRLKIFPVSCRPIWCLCFDFKSCCLLDFFFNYYFFISSTLDLSYQHGLTFCVFLLRSTGGSLLEGCSYRCSHRDQECYRGLDLSFSANLQFHRARWDKDLFNHPPPPPPPVWQLTTFPLHNHLLVPLGAGAVSGVSLPFLWQPLPEESIES